MAAAIKTVAFLEWMYGELLDAVIKVRFETARFEPGLERLMLNLKQIPEVIEVIEDIEKLNRVLDRPPIETVILNKRLMECRILELQGAKPRLCINRYDESLYAKKLKDLEDSLVRFFFQSDVAAQISRDSRKILDKVNRIGGRLDRFGTKGGGVSNGSVFVGCCVVPKVRAFVVGFEEPVRKVKVLVMSGGEQVVVVSGPSGCGKTTLAKMVCHDEEILGMFKDNIFFVTAPKAANLMVIIENLFIHRGFRVPEFQTDEEAIYQLDRMLKQIGPNPILLVLDDVWSGRESLIEDLTTQIPEIKILVTSRFLFPRFKSTYKLKLLSDKDALALFRHSAFGQDGKSYIADDLVDEIVRDCGGFPLALEVVGRLLRGKSEWDWKWTQMRWSQQENHFSSNFNLEISHRLQFSLYSLDTMYKECYLDLASFSQVRRIPAIALVSELPMSVKYLEEKLMFGTCEKETASLWQHYKDYLFNWAIQVQKEVVDLSWLKEMGEVVTQEQRLSSEDEESLNEVTQSLFYKEFKDEILLEELEVTPSNPRELEEWNCDRMEVPPTFSHHFSILHVLDLSYSEINSLPPSISRLIALRKLFLRSCELLMELPPEIGELTNLEVLDVEGTEILYLPKEISKLVNLRCFKVSFDGYANHTVIPRRVFSYLLSLIQLIIDVTPFGEGWDVEVEAIVDDLCCLKELKTLQLYLPTPEPLEKLTLIIRGLANFRFTVGRHEEHFISRLPHDVEEEFNKCEKGLKYLNRNCIPNEVTEVLNHANAFFLQCHWTANSLSEFGHNNMAELKFCLVMECNEFRTIIDSKQFNQGKDGRGESEDFECFDEAIVLGSLERLIVRYMKNMDSIWKGPVGLGSLSNLKSLALHTCPNLTTIFTVDMLISLTNLEELVVEDCSKIDSLVSLRSSDSKQALFLRSLKKISLLGLPELVSISGGLHIAPNLERMVIFYCPKLEMLSTMEVSSTVLKVIKGEKEWWDTLKWYESDLSTQQVDYLARVFVPLRREGDLMAQITSD